MSKPVYDLDGGDPGTPIDFGTQPPPPSAPGAAYSATVGMPAPISYTQAPPPGMSFPPPAMQAQESNGIPPLAYDLPMPGQQSAPPPPAAAPAAQAPAAPFVPPAQPAVAPAAPAPSAPPAAPRLTQSPLLVPAPDANAAFHLPAPEVDPALGWAPPTKAAHLAPAPPAQNAAAQAADPDDEPLPGVLSPEAEEFLQSSTARNGLNPDRDLLHALEEVLRRNASDLHVSANAAPMLRIDGALTPGSWRKAWGPEKVASALRSILTDAQKEIFDRELEYDFAYTVSANARFRVNFYQQREFMGAAFRLIPTEIKRLDDLGVPDSVRQFATLPRGLVLVTGPTGSGKSTTLAALIDLVNRTRADHIMTVEDPIEFLHGNHKSVINQREVGQDTHSFGAALKHVLRQDPDVILIGELRDLETISVALTAAETGHLVFATLHTQDAAQTIDRVIDVFPPHQQGQVRSQLAATIQGVVCQTLVKRATGRGRVVATEVMIATPAIQNLIREGKTYQISSAMQAGGDLGMHTMDRHLADLANTGIITNQAAMDKAQDVEGLRQMIHRVETPSDSAGRAMAASAIDFGDAHSKAIG
jgi:twitching motility protein PilT